MNKDTANDISQSMSNISRAKITNVSRAILLVINGHKYELDESLYARSRDAVYDLIESIHGDRADRDILRNANRVRSYLSIIKDISRDLEDKCLLLMRGVDYVSNVNVMPKVSLESVSNMMDSELEMGNIKDREVVESSLSFIKDKTPELAVTQIGELQSIKDKKVDLASTSKDHLISRAQISRVSLQAGRVLTQSEIESERKKSRKSEVLSILTDVPMSIKEISTHILGCSEKTVQRELNSLLAEGAILKAGEKRWSKYFVSK